MLLLGGMVMLSTETMGQTDGNDNNERPNYPRSPAHSPYAYITYDESNGSILVSFNSAIDEAEILVYQNGMEVDYQVIDATAGMQVPITLSAYGNGEFVIQVKSGSTLLATLNVTM